jgi:hypothetical protein
MAKTTKSKKKELWTDADRRGLAEKKGLNMGRLMSEKDRKEGLLFTKKDREEGLM